MTFSQFFMSHDFSMTTFIFQGFQSPWEPRCILRLTYKLWTNCQVRPMYMDCIMSNRQRSWRQTQPCLWSRPVAMIMTVAPMGGTRVGLLLRPIWRGCANRALRPIRQMPTFVRHFLMSTGHDQFGSFSLASCVLLCKY